MSEPPVEAAVFLTLVRTASERAKAQLLIDSIRSFGGELGRCPVWVFEKDPARAASKDLEGAGVEILPLDMPGTSRGYYFADKVLACARAEALAQAKARSLIWIASDCLNIRNVGLTPSEPLDEFWRGTYEAVGVRDVRSTVETFVDGQHIRAYYNSHVFAVNPAAGLLRRWYDCFEGLVCDEAFQARACQGEGHQVFLHQAVLSALLATSLEPGRLRLLPPTYSYPYNLHRSVPPERRARTLNELVCIAYEDRSLHPDQVSDIDIDEPLRSWLSVHAVAARPV
jgi:hypothetical protein